ncbi:MAG: DUF2490 domain-containing protein [Crocinitomicaceae bacterium]
MKNILLVIMLSFSLIPVIGRSQVNQDEIGVWYMYNYSIKFKESVWGMQGDVQYRSWNFGNDVEQFILRTGATLNPKNTDFKLTLGYGYIVSGAYGEEKSTSCENRIYQEAFFPKKIGTRIYTGHRFRYEQRFVSNHNFRTRYRYNLFLNIPLNRDDMIKNTFYITLYNELFINGQKNIGNDQSVAIFDRNRFYVATGYLFKDNLKVQFGIMNQVTNTWKKNQFQISLHHDF